MFRELLAYNVVSEDWPFVEKEFYAKGWFSRLKVSAKCVVNKQIFVLKQNCDETQRGVPALQQSCYVRVHSKDGGRSSTSKIKLPERVRIPDSTSG